MTYEPSLPHTARGPRPIILRLDAHARKLTALNAGRSLLRSQKFRAELDEARNARLGASSGGGDEKKKKKHKDKHKDKHKHKKHKHEDSEKKKKKKRRRESSSDDSEDSEDDEKKKPRKEGSGKADGPVSLRAFFQQGSDSE